ncbi:MAG: bifunctional UDP-N-acetylglucosamine diphosphorylase/glucosamine-1-phosphate N-acetyltransferase GlmU [Armatimonadota bacterium]|nr:bifunctional UDP-N-acetylglucosamine diphosphorylase/glucosamine-1-phosphate N-acetyltransferase GlmU [Armatimonadota bacterium]MDR7439819.1 bifunctional UDP-N-acetylglucosamine diphosphorylase/glucosamine-1-phosphate N-acetyltransferase GlmU [Armatimonadota bacterium]MDR7563703.1 bifunctional UDP-N-acetylglucosamine diphosphorylase/glucosamine-1-phosphate N-acetyltransferase GlmU [Armatimonadota bacterium]MDR7601651.1 bifunctional UDP-N-acetylglucosamine diphosphorylase/glucosamine-1-phospha
MSVAAVVLAAGQGKRMRSRLPKVLHPLCGRPLLLYVLEALQPLVQGPLVVVVGEGAERVRAVLPDGVSVAVQDRPLGTGHAVACALPHLEGLEGPVIVAYGDIPLVRTATFRLLVERHAQEGNAATLVSARVPDPTGYGRVIRRADGTLDRVVEEADATPEERAVLEVNTGLGCFEVKALREVLPRIRADNAQGEYYLTDAFRLLREGGSRVGILQVREAEEVMGINTRKELAQAEAEMRRRILEELMASGVTVVDPATTYVDSRARIGPDTVVHPFTVIEGETTVGRGCVLGPGAHLISARLGDGVRVWWSVVEHSEIGEGSRVGPYAHLRPGCVLGRGVEVGNFAELKNARVGDRTKVHHVSYLGDALVGQEVNIGAGTVTCNLRYGVVGKQQTVIEDGAFIGSDTMLQAPVRVGAGAVTGAGTVVTHDLPPGAVAVGVPARVIRTVEPKSER